MSLGSLRHTVQGVYMQLQRRLAKYSVRTCCEPVSI